MRIAHVLLGRCNPLSANGVDQAIYHLSKSQAQMNHDVSVWNITTKLPINIPGVEVHSTPPSRFGFRASQVLLDGLLAFTPDIVHFHSVFCPPFQFAARSLRSHRIPYVSTPHGGLSPHVLRRRFTLKLLYILFLERPFMLRADFIHVVSANEIRDIERYRMSCRFLVAPNGIDVESIPEAYKGDKVVEKFPQGVGRRVFLFLGRISEKQKGLDLLLEAVRRSGSTFDNSLMVLAGPDSNGDLAKLQNRVRELNLQDRVVFTSGVEGRNKFALLQAADVFVHTSRWEGMPFSVIEALACSKPCLITHQTNLGALVADFQAGVVVDPDPSAIQKALHSLILADEQDLRAKGRNARSLAVQLNWANPAATLIAGYENVISKRAHSSNADSNWTIPLDASKSGR